MHSDLNFGQIEFVRNQRAKHIRVRILSNGLKVTLPQASTEKMALDFIKSEKQKIQKKQQEITNKAKNASTFLTENSELQTLSFKVTMKPSDRENIFFSLKNKILTIEYPTTVNFQTEKIQTHFWNGINYFLRKEAKRILPDRTQELAAKFGFSYTAVKIQSSKTRWGSCSRAGNINLSLYLMLLPTHLVDYVILHELCHTKELNHSDKFWHWMDRVTENKTKEYRQEMKNYHMPN